MSGEYQDVVDLDKDPSDPGPVSNTAWAARLFPGAPDTAEADPYDGASTDDDEQDASTPAPAEDAPTSDRPPVDFAALSAMMSGLPGANDPIVADDTGHDPAKSAGMVWTVVHGAAAAVCSVLIVGTTVITSADPPPPPKEEAVPVLVAGAPLPDPQAVAPVDDIDIPYWAHDPSCYNGNDSDPNAMRQSATNAVWNCLRGFGGVGGGIDGHTVTVSLGDERNGARPYLVSEIAITPGWVPKVPGGEDEWDGHRVPTRLRYIFNDSPDPARQTKWNVDTNNRRGPVPYRGERPVLASQVTIVVLETSRPPKQDVPSGGAETTTPNFPDLPGSRGQRGTGSDDEITPADATFAVSALQVKGHVPG
ncbi:hypothetical protein ONA92_26455 [Mycobacteroides salmoniphilum]|uniref:hypothetical protein n=1 Tax=Mycobacteroides salmoniphilum TaxID=404941 RepID=UPI003564CEC2